MGFQWSDLNPANWFKFFGGIAINQIISAFFYILDMILNAIVTLFNIVMAFGMSTFEGMVVLIVNLAVAMGPLSLPVLIVGFVGITGAFFLAFGVLKDAPVVGSFV